MPKNFLFVVTGDRNTGSQSQPFQYSDLSSALTAAFYLTDNSTSSTVNIEVEPSVPHYVLLSDIANN